MTTDARAKAATYFRAGRVAHRRSVLTVPASLTARTRAAAPRRAWSRPTRPDRRANRTDVAGGVIRHAPSSFDVYSRKLYGAKGRSRVLWQTWHHGFATATRCIPVGPGKYSCPPKSRRAPSGWAAQVGATAATRRLRSRSWNSTATNTVDDCSSMRPHSTRSPTSLPRSASARFALLRNPVPDRRRRFSWS